MMNCSRAGFCAALTLFCAVAAQAEPTATGAPAETQGAKDTRAARAAFREKQKQVAEEQGMPSEPQPSAATPATLIDLPQDETDSPGADK